MPLLKNYQSKIVVLLTRQELLVGEIYRFFAGLFPESRDLWNTLAEEEMEHAGWLEYLYKKSQDGTARFNEDRIKTYTVESFVKYLEDNLARVKERAPTQQAAFSLAMNIENSLLVKKLFDHFETTDKELSALLQDLRDKMPGHRKQIEEAASLIFSPARAGA